MATFQGGASSDAAPLVLEIIKLTNLPKREHDRTRCPFLRVHLEPADAPPPPPRSPEVSPKDLAKLMAQKSLSEEDAARVKDALATGTTPAPEEQKKGRWSRTRAAAARAPKEGVIHNVRFTSAGQGAPRRDARATKRARVYRTGRDVAETEHALPSILRLFAGRGALYARRRRRSKGPRRGGHKDEISGRGARARRLLSSSTTPFVVELAGREAPLK